MQWIGDLSMYVYPASQCSSVLQHTFVCCCILKICFVLC